MAKPPFGFEQAEHSPGFVLWQVTIVWQRTIKKALSQYDVSHAQFVLLATLLWFKYEQTEARQIALIEWTKLDKMIVSKSLGILENKMLVKRVEHPIYTRAKLVKLTKKGETLARQLIPIVEKIDAEYFGILNKDEQNTLLKLLLKMSYTLNT